MKRCMRSCASRVASERLKPVGLDEYPFDHPGGGHRFLGEGDCRRRERGNARRQAVKEQPRRVGRRSRFTSPQRSVDEVHFRDDNLAPPDHTACAAFNQSTQFAPAGRPGAGHIPNRAGVGACTGLTSEPIPLGRQAIRC
jgi:hypothetical protein